MKIKEYKEENKIYFVVTNYNESEVSEIEKFFNNTSGLADSTIESNATIVQNLVPKEYKALPVPKGYTKIPWENATKAYIQGPECIKYLDSKYLSLDKKGKEYLLKEDMGPWSNAMEELVNTIAMKNIIFLGKHVFSIKIAEWFKLKGIKTPENEDEYNNSLYELLNNSADDEVKSVFSFILKLTK